MTDRCTLRLAARKACHALSLTLIALPALADVAGAVNEARLRDCHTNLRPLFKLRESSRLDEAARQLSRGETLQNATRKAGYRALAAGELRITNVPTDLEVQRIVAKQFCAQLTNRDLQDIGTYRRGSDVWVLVATPFAPPAPEDRQTVSRRVLELTNEARAHARLCGSVPFPAAPPLTLGPATLERAAAEHSKDMAQHNYMDHTGRDGSSPGDRVTRAGYRWKTVGENLASGIVSPEEVVKGWVGSPHHCENLMDPRFTQMAVTYGVNPSSTGGIYWTQLFGTPP
jgi:uncharacterized protein YkwD